MKKYLVLMLLALLPTLMMAQVRKKPTTKRPVTTTRAKSKVDTSKDAHPFIGFVFNK